MMVEQESILERILDMLGAARVQFRHLHHEPTRTSAESARVRGESTEIGGKALLIKAHDRYHLFVLSAALKLDSAALKRQLDTRRPRFATTEELHELTGLVPGAVPPFGAPILPFPLFLDRSITRNQRIAFNAGTRTDSIIMQVEDYLKLAVIESLVEVAR